MGNAVTHMTGFRLTGKLGKKVILGAPVLVILLEVEGIAAGVAVLAIPFNEPGVPGI